MRLSPVLDGLQTYPFVRLAEAQARLTRARRADRSTSGSASRARRRRRSSARRSRRRSTPISTYPQAEGCRSCASAIAGWVGAPLRRRARPGHRGRSRRSAPRRRSSTSPRSLGGDLVAGAAARLPGVRARRGVRRQGGAWSCRCAAANGFLPDLDAVDAGDVGARRRCCGSTTRTTRRPPPRTLELYERAAALAREHDFVLACDEAYSELYFGADAPVSALQVADRTNVAVFNTLSKRSSMPGYRSGFVAGDPELVAALKRYRPERRRRAAGVRPARGGRRLGRRGARRRGARRLPRQARRAAAGARGRRASATRAATRRSSCGSRATPRR